MYTGLEARCMYRWHQASEPSRFQSKVLPPDLADRLNLKVVDGKIIYFTAKQELAISGSDGTA